MVENTEQIKVPVLQIYNFQESGPLKKKSNSFKSYKINFSDLSFPNSDPDSISFLTDELREEMYFFEERPRDELKNKLRIEKNYSFSPRKKHINLMDKIQIKAPIVDFGLRKNSDSPKKIYLPGKEKKKNAGQSFFGLQRTRTKKE